MAPNRSTPTGSEIAVDAAVLGAFLALDRRTPLIVAQRSIAAALGLAVSTVRASTRRLVAQGELAFTDELGSALVGPATDRGVQVTPGIRVRPPNASGGRKGPGIDIVLQPGIAFGNGTHPTTVIALSLMERHLTALPAEVLDGGLDIGTGSGILAIALAMWRPMPILAIDSDPCARFEVLENIRLNRLSDRIAVDQRDLSNLQGRFAAVLANLRFPTLAGLSGSLPTLMAHDGLCVCSGLLVSEYDGLVDRYRKAGFALLSFEMRGRWAGAAFRYPIPI